MVQSLLHPPPRRARPAGTKGGHPSIRPPHPPIPRRRRRNASVVRDISMIQFAPSPSVAKRDLEGVKCDAHHHIAGPQPMKRPMSHFYGSQHELNRSVVWERCFWELTVGLGGTTYTQQIWSPVSDPSWHAPICYVPMRREPVVRHDWPGLTRAWSRRHRVSSI